MLNQKLQLKLSQKLSPQQIQLMKLIQLTTAELEQKIKNEIEQKTNVGLQKESQKISQSWCKHFLSKLSAGDCETFCQHVLQFCMPAIAKTTSSFVELNISSFASTSLAKVLTSFKLAESTGNSLCSSNVIIQ